VKCLYKFGTVFVFFMTFGCSMQLSIYAGENDMIDKQESIAIADAVEYLSPIIEAIVKKARIDVGLSSDGGKSRRETGIDYQSDGGTV